MITSIENISISNEFKILKFTVHRYIDESLSTILTYEIPPSFKTEGVWVPTEETIFEEPELQELVRNHLHHWPEDLRLEYERQQDIIEARTLGQQITLSNEEIDAILQGLE